MGRREPTPEELKAGSALVEKIRQTDAIVSDVEFSDSPDLRLRLSGHPFGCEIVSLLPTDVQKTIAAYTNFMYKKKGIRVCRFVIPDEPHYWANAVVEKKWAKAKSYPKDDSTNSLSLLIHRPLHRQSNIIDFDDPGFVQRVLYGARSAAHGFANIFYWSGKDVYHVEGSRTILSDLKPLNLEIGYPAYVLWSQIGTEIEINQSFSGTGVSLIAPDEHTKILRPMTPDWRNLKPALPPENVRVKISR